MPTTLAPLAEREIPCSSLVLTVGGTPTSASDPTPLTMGTVLGFVDGGLTPNYATDDMTNSLDQGARSDLLTTRGWTLNATLTANSPAIMNITIGGLYYVTIGYTAGTPPTAPTVGPYFAGKMRLMLSGDAILDITKGIRYKLTGTSNGLFVVGMNV